MEAAGYQLQQGTAPRQPLTLVICTRLFASAISASLWIFSGESATTMTARSSAPRAGVAKRPQQAASEASLVYGPSAPRTSYRLQLMEVGGWWVSHLVLHAAGQQQCRCL